LLAALAQVEGNGNPTALTHWRWQWSWNPFEIYRPASSALGMFQITDGTFAEARKYCIRNHGVVNDGPWYDLRSCWFNNFYTRTLPSHSIEMTAAYLHHSVVDILAARGTAKAKLAQKQKLAAVIHLCGLKRGENFVTSGFRETAGERCGTHGLRRYLTQVDLMKQRFAQLRARYPYPQRGNLRPQKAPTSFEVGAFNLNPAASYSSIEQPYSTIGAGGLNGRVRDGIGCDTSAIATGNLENSYQVSVSGFQSKN
jgi:hypothetical protein